MSIRIVRISNKAKKDLVKLPWHIVMKLESWIELVSSQGLSDAKKIPGYHDEPLKGKRIGQRSIRLSKAYRAIYKKKDDGVIEFIEVQEVNKHEY